MVAMSIGSIESDTFTMGFAPIDNCRALAPMSLALSNLVSFFAGINIYLLGSDPNERLTFFYKTFTGSIKSFLIFMFDLDK